MVECSHYIGLHHGWLEPLLALFKNFDGHRCACEPVVGQEDLGVTPLPDGPQDFVLGVEVFLLRDMGLEAEWW